jgi:anti-anti-sigma factor
MRPGQILVADHNGVYVIKMVGDVRLTLCISFDQFIDTMLNDKALTAVLFDLSEAEAVDSTTLGLMAKIALKGHERRSIVPVILSPNPGIDRVLSTMGFQDIFSVVNTLETPIEPAQALITSDAEESLVREKVLEAHKILMGMNRENHQAFHNLVKMLENN